MVLALFFGDDEDIEPAKGLGVAGKGAVGCGNQDAAQFFGVAGANLNDARIIGAGGAVGAQNQFQPRGQIEIVSAQRNRIKIGGGRLDKPLHGLFSRAGGDERGGAGGVEQAFGAEIVGVGVSGALARENADAAAGAGALRGRFYDLLIDAESRCSNRLEVEVGVVAACTKGLAQAAFQEALGDAKLLKKITVVAAAGTADRAAARGSVWCAHRTSQFTPPAVGAPSVRVTARSSLAWVLCIPMTPKTKETGDRAGRAACSYFDSAPFVLFRGICSRANIRFMNKILALALLLMVFSSPAFAAGRHHHHHYNHHHHHSA